MGETVTIDAVVAYPDGRYVVVLIEEGPWVPTDTNEQIQILQERVVKSIGLVVDGSIAELYPETSGEQMVIRLDCYDIPTEPVSTFFEALAEKATCSTELQQDIEESEHLSSLEFELNFKTLKDTDA